MDKKILNLIEINADYAGEKRGSALASKALRQVAFCQKSDLYTKFKSIITLDLPNNCVQSTAHQHIKYGDELLPFYKVNIPIISKQLQTSDTTIIVSGDHANAISIIASLQQSYPSKKIGIIWIDAHADLHNPYTSPSGNLHGMSLGVFFNSHAMHNETNNIITNESAELWDNLCNLNETSNAMDNKNLVYLGLRSVETEELKVIEQKIITNHSSLDVREKGIINIANQIIKQLSACDIVYISFDVDALDVSISTGTGTPVRNGFTVNEINTLLEMLISGLPIKILEITEINPLLDTENKMAIYVFAIIEKAIALL